MSPQSKWTSGSQPGEAIDASQLTIPTALSTNDMEMQNRIESWGVPRCICDRYAELGIRELYSWQAECLGVNSGKVIMGGNLVYSAPTGGGKTVVAEILMIRNLVYAGKSCLFVVPYVSIVIEKVSRPRSS